MNKLKELEKKYQELGQEIEKLKTEKQKKKELVELAREIFK